LAFGAGGVSLGYRSEPSGLPGGPGREPGVFSAKSVANTHMDAEWRIVQKRLVERSRNSFANSTVRKAFLGCVEQPVAISERPRLFGWRRWHFRLPPNEAPEHP